MSKTKKDDWLNDYFSNNNFFVSGHDNFRKDLNLPSASVPAVRYINFRQNFLWLLTIESPTTEWNDIKLNLIYNDIFQFINSKFEFKLNVLLFSSDDYISFSFKKFDGEFIDVDSSALKKILASMVKDVDQNPGTIKEKNKSLNDNFQVWTRENLSRYCVINDFDVLYLSNKIGEKSAIYELKRVDESIDTWQPYTNDSKNYDRIRKIALKLDFSDLTIAYNTYNTEKFAIHYNIRPETLQIAGEKVIYDINENKYEENSKVEYVSTRIKRKKN